MSLGTLRGFRMFLLYSIQGFARGKRAKLMHHFYVMESQNDVEFSWVQRASLNAQIWVLGRIAAP